MKSFEFKSDLMKKAVEMAARKLSENNNEFPQRLLTQEEILARRPITPNHE